MTEKAKKRKLQAAKTSKKDEFYTQLGDIERELRYYKSHFKDKVVYCNCDDPRVSNFFHFFSYNFEKLGLKKLIATCYKNQDMDLFSENKSEQAIYLVYEGDKNDNKVPDPNEIGIKMGNCRKHPANRKALFVFHNSLLIFLFYDFLSFSFRQ
jgi:hypothetical protein